jgi:hypothetical protein
VQNDGRVGSIANRFRCSIEPLLLRDLIAVVEIELVDELVERHGEIGRAVRAICATSAKLCGRAMVSSSGLLKNRVAIVGDSKRLLDDFAIKLLPFRHRVDISAPVPHQV